MPKNKLDYEMIKKAVEWDMLHKLTGVKFCVTGVLSLQRSDVTFLIVKMGGEVQNAVTSSTDYLIIPNGEGYRKGSKYQAAVSGGATILSEADFCEMIVPSAEDLLGRNS